MKIIKFSAPWCGPCKQMAKNLEKLRIEGLQIDDVNIDDNPEFASHYNIVSIPTILFINNGIEVERTSGVVSEEKIRELIKKHGISI